MRRVSGLTEIEKELLQLKVDGFTYKEIAEKRQRSIHTVETQFWHIRTKLGARTMYEAVACAFRQGWLK